MSGGELEIAQRVFRRIVTEQHTAACVYALFAGPLYHCMPAPDAQQVLFRPPNDVDYIDAPIKITVEDDRAQDEADAAAAAVSARRARRCDTEGDLDDTEDDIGGLHPPSAAIVDASLVRLAQQRRPHVLNIQRVRDVCRCNKFAVDRLPGSEMQQQQHETDTGFDASDMMPAVGLWLLPSLFNHSCASNCYRFFIGDFMFIRTVVPVAAGEELTISYVTPADSLDERQEAFRVFQFECSCARCAAERSEPPSVRDERAEFRRFLFDEVRSQLAQQQPLPNDTLQRLQQIIKRLQSLPLLTAGYDLSLALSLLADAYYMDTDCDAVDIATQRADALWRHCRRSWLYVSACTRMMLLRRR